MSTNSRAAHAVTPRLLGPECCLIACLSMLAVSSSAALAGDSDPLQGIPSLPPLHSRNDAPRLQGGSQSTMLQGGSKSTMLQAGSQSTMLQAGSQSTLLQAGSQSTMLQGGTTGTIIQGNVEHYKEKLNILFLLDCSFSMKEKFSGGESGAQEEKMAAAKQVLEESMARIPADVNVGLRTFGQGSSHDTETDCRQTALLMPLGIHNRGGIIDRVRQIKPFGLTPIEYSIKQAAEDDFRGSQGSKVIILISDGADTCGGDPCEFIRQLPRYGVKIKVDVVGVNLKGAAKDQLDCIAETSDGKFYDVHSAGELIRSVSQSVDKALSGRVIMKPRANGVNAKNTETVPEPTPVPNTVQ